MPDAVARAPRWDPDERGIGVGDARTHIETLDALRLAAAEAGWIAEEPEAHLLPHILRHIAQGSPWVIESTSTEPDGTFVIVTRWTGPADTELRTIRAAAYGLIGVIAETTTAVHERQDPHGVVIDVVTGMLPGETEFASHGHTLRLSIRRPIEADHPAGRG